MGYKHGMTNTREFASWCSMKNRCYNPNCPKYKIYGGRGIKVCKHWLGENGFINFYNDMGDRPPETTLERVNNNKNYTPKNCKWATVTEQNRNKRTNKLTIAKVKIIKELKNKLTQRELSEMFNVNQSTISDILTNNYWKGI